LHGTALSVANYDATLIGWAGWTGGAATRPIRVGMELDATGLQYSLGGEAEAVRDWYINTMSWSITDGGGI